MTITTDGKVTVQLEKRKDNYGATFYVGKIRPTPLTIDCEKGVAFLIFTSIDGEEEMQISLMNNNENKLKNKDNDTKIYRMKNNG